MESVNGSITFPLVKIMTKETADQQARQNGQRVLSIPSILQTVYVLITLQQKRNAIMMVVTVVNSPCLLMETVKNSTTFLPVKTMTKGTVDLQVSTLFLSSEISKFAVFRQLNS